MYHPPLDHHNHLSLDHSLESESRHASRAQRGRRRSFSILRALPRAVSAKRRKT